MNAEQGRAGVEPRADELAYGGDSLDESAMESTEGSAAASEMATQDDAGRCKYPGCRRDRQPKMNRRGAPPAYCADPTHEPDASRRERVRRRRLGLARDAVLDEYDRPLTEIGSGSRREAEAGWPQWAELPQPRDPSERLGGEQATTAVTAPLASVPHDDSDALATGHSAALARRLADQLALAATAYEQLADQIAATDAENAELRERLRTMEAPSDSRPDSGPAPDPSLE